MPARRNVPRVGATGSPPECCRVESVISIDERGQMVLPKDVREKTNIRAGEKVALISCDTGQLSCLLLVKVEDLTGLVTQFLGPLVNQMGRP